MADTAAELERFEAARQKAIEQQTALYEKALAEAGEDIAEVFNIHAMMLDDDDFVDAIKEIINGQKMCAEYAVKTAGNNQAAVFSAMDDPYLQARSADVLDIAQAMLDILQGVDNASLQGTEPSILVAEDLAPSETVRMDKSLLLGFITREGSSNSHTAILARSMNIPALIQCKDIQDDWDGKMAVVDGYNACVYVDPTPRPAQEPEKAPAGGPEKAGSSAGAEGQAQHHTGRQDHQRVCQHRRHGRCGRCAAERRRRRGSVPHRVRLPELQGLPPPKTTSSRLTSRWWKALHPARWWCAPVISARTRPWII